jgi:pimeloyl-ACP methyl ester carboxylesterase
MRREPGCGAAVVPPCAPDYGAKRNSRRVRAVGRRPAWCGHRASCFCMVFRTIITSTIGYCRTCVTGTSSRSTFSAGATRTNLPNTPIPRTIKSGRSTRSSARSGSTSAHRAFFGLNEDLRPAIRARAKRVGELRKFERPVRILFGDADPYLNKDVARDLARLFPNADLHLAPGARHFVQMDEPERVAQEITRN